MWVSRQDDTARAVILFCDRIPETALGQTGELLSLTFDSVICNALHDLAVRLDVMIIPAKGLACLWQQGAGHLGFAVLLCYLRGSGFPPDKSISPHDGAVSRLATHLKLQPDLWTEYASREVTRWEHLAELYRYLELSPFNRALQKTAFATFIPTPCGQTEVFYLQRKCSPGSTIIR